MTPGLVTAGEQVYNTLCIACHAPNLEGLIGPSFVDDEWIHGRSVADILRIIREGVPEKGMVPWGPILSAQQINSVAAFVIQRNMDATGRSFEDYGGAGSGG